MYLKRWVSYNWLVFTDSPVFTGPQTVIDYGHGQQVDDRMAPVGHSDGRYYITSS